MATHKVPRDWTEIPNVTGSDFVMKMTPHGVKYMCRYCQRKPLTAGQKIHWAHCKGAATPPKLSTAQTDTLRLVCRFPDLQPYRFNCFDSYKPALKLIELGLATSREENSRRIALEATAAGRALDQVLNPKPVL